MKVIRLKNEGQENPKDQMKCTVSSIRGWIHNLQSGRSAPDRVANFINSDLDRVLDLLDRYPDLEWGDAFGVPLNTSSVTKIKAKLFVEHVDEMTTVFNSEADIEVKYELVLKLAKELRDMGMKVEYYDPDTSYEEDTWACYNAYKAQSEQYIIAFEF
jgi:hypothetical protein